MFLPPSCEDICHEYLVGRWHQFVRDPYIPKGIKSLALLNEDLILENGWLCKIPCTSDSAET